MNDALIFDMDGTLWDATESYATIWNRGYAEIGDSTRITGDELKQYMGLALDEIYRKITSTKQEREALDAFLQRIDTIENNTMSQLGGFLYDYVPEGLKALSSRYRIFMLSNCGAEGVNNFLKYTGLGKYIEASLTFGERSVPKGENLKYIAEKYSLLDPIYIGDTQGDCDESHKAGMKFVYMTYGFGTCDNFDLKFDSFKELTDYFISK